MKVIILRTYLISIVSGVLIITAIYQESNYRRNGTRMDDQLDTTSEAFEHLAFSHKTKSRLKNSIDVE